MRTSTLERDLNLRPLAGSGEIEKPRAWTADWVKHRMVEAFTIERRIPDKRVGPAGAWAKIATTDSFSDRVYQGELARENVWEAWARAGGALPYEVSRMEEALSWPGQVLSNGHATEGKVLLAWAVLRGLRQATEQDDAPARLVALYVLPGSRYRLTAHRRLSQSAGRGIALSRQPHIEGGALPAPSLAHQTTQIPEIQFARRACGAAN